MKTVLFLVEKFPYGKMAEQLAGLVNRLEDVSITVQVLHDGEKYRDLFEKHIGYKAEAFPVSGTALLPRKYLYNRIVKEKYDTAVAWTEGSCVRILSGCTCGETRLYGMIHSDLSENGRFTDGFRSWYDARRSYQNLHGCFVSNISLLKPFCSVSGIEASRIRVIPPVWEVRGSPKDVFRRKYGTPGTLQVCSVGENMTASEIRRLYKIHVQLLSEGYWHRMIVIAGKKRMHFSRDTFLHLSYDKHMAGLAAGCDIFLCINGEASVLDAMADAIRAGVPAVAVEGRLADSILNHGTRGILTGDTAEEIQSGLRSMMTKPTLRYVCSKNARKWNSDCDSMESVRRIQEVLQGDAGESVEFIKNIEKSNVLCYNPFDESGTVTQ